MKIHSPRFYLKAMGLSGIASFLSWLLFYLAFLEDQVLGMTLFVTVTLTCITFLSFSIVGFILSLAMGGE